MEWGGPREVTFLAEEPLVSYGAGRRGVSVIHGVTFCFYTHIPMDGPADTESMEWTQSEEKSIWRREGKWQRG